MISNLAKHGTSDGLSRIIVRNLTIDSLKKAHHAGVIAGADIVAGPLIAIDPDLCILMVSQYPCRGCDRGSHNAQEGPADDLGMSCWSRVSSRASLNEIISQFRHPEAHKFKYALLTSGRPSVFPNARQPSSMEKFDCKFSPILEGAGQQPKSDTEISELVLQNEMLMQELQHRVSNSLQIIASILQLKARSVRSEEARLHLNDACRQVLSVAMVQQQLQSAEHRGKIKLGVYLSELCAYLAKSLIDESRSLSIAVQAGECMAESPHAGSVGLIVTELVINALKHAFPDGRSGRILVNYDVAGDDWQLSVSDDGVGQQDDAKRTQHRGLGTKIVEALAHQLAARIDVSSGSQGTKVAVIHESKCRNG